MKTLAIFLFALVGLSQSEMLLPYSLPNELIQFMGHREQTQNAAISVCQDVQFNYCQTTFNQFFGMDDSITWRNGTYIFNTVQKYLMMNVTELVKVCNTRTQFYQCLGTSYYTCMNLYTLLNKPNPDVQQTFDYVRTFRGLEWMCVGGFSEVVAQWDCLGNIPTTNAYQTCINNFQQTVTADNFCNSVDQTGQCLNDVYNERCGVNAAGYFGCENFRITFDNSCWGLRCMVSPQN